MRVDEKKHTVHTNKNEDTEKKLSLFKKPVILSERSWFEYCLSASEVMSPEHHFQLGHLINKLGVCDDKNFNYICDHLNYAGYWFKRAADEGHPFAQLKLANFHCMMDGYNELPFPTPEQKKENFIIGMKYLEAVEKKNNPLSSIEQSNLIASYVAVLLRGRLSRYIKKVFPRWNFNEEISRTDYKPQLDCYLVPAIKSTTLPKVMDRDFLENIRKIISASVEELRDSNQHLLEALLLELKQDEKSLLEDLKWKLSQIKKKESEEFADQTRLYEKMSKESADLTSLYENRLDVRLRAAIAGYKVGLFYEVPKGIEKGLTGTNSFINSSSTSSSDSSSTSLSTSNSSSSSSSSSSWSSSC